MKKFLGIAICLAVIVQLIACRVIDIDGFLNIFPFSNNVSNGEILQKNSKSAQYSGKIQRTPIVSSDIDQGNCGSFVNLSQNRPKGSSRYKVVTQTTGYDSLELGSQRRAYKKMLESAYQICSRQNEQGYYPSQPIVIYDEQMPEEEIRKSVYAFQLDNPLVFWIANMFGFDYSDSNTIIQLYSMISPSECNASISKANEKIDEVISTMPQEMSEFNRELYLHDFLLNNCEYDTSVTGQKDEWRAFTMYGALVNGKAVCEGYAKAMEALLSYAQMQCTLVNGVSSQSLHMWNAVMVDNNWYHLDVTWDDSDQMNRYDYFNVTDEIISKDHIIDPDYRSLSKDEICGTDNASPRQYNLGLPECYELYSNYFRAMAVELDSLNHSSDEKIDDRLYNMAQNKQEYFSIKISNNLDYQSTIQKIFLKQPYKFLYYISEVNKRLDEGHQIDSSKIIYAEAENQNSVTIRLSYF